MSTTLSFFPRTLIPTPRVPRLTTAITCQWTPPQRPVNEPVPPRDRVMEFGKHKGKMLGTLPSKYLEWMSKKLRFKEKEWAVLAEQVLADPVYRERFEWQFADQIMKGEVKHECGEEALMEIKDRFGWDFEDKVGWSKVKLKLLGTSYGGSIPRVKEGIQPEAAVEEVEEEEEIDVSELEARARRRARKKAMRRVEVREGKLGFLLEGKGNLGNSQEIGGGGGGDKIDERVEKRFPGREGNLGINMSGRGSLGNAQEIGVGGGGDKKEERVEKRFPGREGNLGINMSGRGSLGNAQERSGGDEGDRRRVESGGSDVILKGRFPGREGLLRKVLNRRNPLPN